jgi:alkaline phosphatase D
MRFVSAIIGALLLTTAVSADGPYLANGVKVGEVSQESAVLWARLTAEPERREGIVLKRAATTLPADVKVDDLHGAVPGAPGRARVRVGTKEDLADAAATSWASVAAERDFTCEMRITGLKPATIYHYVVEAAPPGADSVSASLNGRFETMPSPNAEAEACFTVITGQMYKDLDDPDGFLIYDAMGALKPKFIVPTGDSVYLDNEPPIANSVALVRHHWHRMYSLPRLVRFHLQVPGYWEKDDHDTYFNDCWPTMKPRQMQPLTYEQGLGVFREQVPAPARMYRTVRWGRNLEVWLVEGRDFRSPNNMPDGPDKSIWGDEQKEWLKKTLLARDVQDPGQPNADRRSGSRQQGRQPCEHGLCPRRQRGPPMGGRAPAEELHDLLRRPSLAVPLRRSGHRRPGILLRPGQR